MNESSSSNMDKMDRSKFIGGSDIPSILGCGFQTPLELYYNKIKGVKIVRNDAMKIGTYLEPIIRKLYFEKYPPKDTDKWLINDVPIVHPKYSYLKGHLDALNQATNNIVEFKSTSRFIGNSLPLSYSFQVAFYRLITQAPEVIIVILSNTNRLHFFKYKRSEHNSRLEDYVLKQALNFWEHLKEGNPPRANCLEEIQIENRELYEKLEPQTFRLDEEGCEEKRAAYYKCLDSHLKVSVAKQNYERDKLTFLTMIKDFQSIKNDQEEEIVTYKFSAPVMRCDVNKLKKEYPDIWEKVRCSGDPRRSLLFKKIHDARGE